MEQNNPGEVAVDAEVVLENTRMLPARPLTTAEHAEFLSSIDGVLDATIGDAFVPPSTLDEGTREFAIELDGDLAAWTLDERDIEPSWRYRGFVDRVETVGDAAGDDAVDEGAWLCFDWRSILQSEYPEGPGEIASISTVDSGETVDSMLSGE